MYPLLIKSCKLIILVFFLSVNAVKKNGEGSSGRDIKRKFIRYLIFRDQLLNAQFHLEFDLKVWMEDKSGLPEDLPKSQEIIQVECYY